MFTITKETQTLTYGGSWSDAQMCSNPMTTPNHWINGDDDKHSHFIRITNEKSTDTNKEIMLFLGFFFLNFYN